MLLDCAWVGMDQMKILLPEVWQTRMSCGDGLSNELLQLRELRH